MMSIRTAACMALLGVSTVAGAQQPPSTIEELWAIVQAQQAEIDELRAELGATRKQVDVTSVKVEETGARVEATGDFVETLASNQSAGRSASIAGYGELHYNQVETDTGSSEEIDFHRFVLFFGYNFTDRVRFFSEFELEHSIAGDGQPGEIELEQAFVEYGLTDKLYARTGLYLVPIGILNETHEPTTFYGVERNDVENIILPSTWWEAGAALNGRYENGISWDLALHSGLAIPTEGSNAFRVRSGRQKVAEALASDPAYTARLKYTGIPGLELSASYQYQSDPSQVAGDGLDVGQLFTAHAAYRRAGFGLRALYGVWNFDGAAVEAAAADRQSGWYVEPSYRLTENWGFYARYEDIDGARSQDKFSQREVGFNYWPVPGVVLKMDYRNRAHSVSSLSGEDFNAVDLGFGYAF